MPAIVKPNQHFNVVTYTATPGSGATVSGVGFQPDLLWVKNRNNVESHYWQDSVRGFSPSTGVTKMLVSNSTAAEANVTGITCTTTSDGFTVADSVPASGEFWFTNRTYVAWAWKASNAEAVTNTAGSITSQVSANPTAGFSIVTWTGTGTNRPSIGHGLGVAPAMIIEKGRDAGSGPFNWVVQHIGLSSWNNSLFLSATNSENSGSGGGTAPSSTVYYAAANNYAGENNVRYVAYCFAPVAGYSAFGSYTGNGSTDGPFIYTGFRPRMLIIKRSGDGTNDWAIIDTTREPNNMGIIGLKPNATEAEYSGYNYRDILSNGFKLRNGDSDTNNNGSTYIYAAFAEAPFKYANAR